MLFRTEDGVVRNPYKWISKKEEQERRNKKKAGEKPTDTSQVMFAYNTEVKIFTSNHVCISNRFALNPIDF